MEKYEDEVNLSMLSEAKIDELEEKRVSQLNDAGIDEGEVIDKAQNNIGAWSGYFNENNVQGKSDMEFVLRNQWTNEERQEFIRLGKTPMQFNKLYDPIKKIIAEQRKNKPDLMVRSLTGKASQQDIDLRSDLIRTISYQSQNDLVYQCAFKSSLIMGYGAFQVGLDYESPRSLNKTIRYDIIPDATMCSWDPTAIKPHKGDGNFCYRKYIMSHSEFFATFPYITDPISFVDPYLNVDYPWMMKDAICIADGFVKEWYPLIVYELSNGEMVTEDEWKEREKKFEDLKEHHKDTVTGEIISKDIPTIIGKRQTQEYRIMHYRMIQDRILDFSEWPSRQLPIPFVDGDSSYLDGRQYTKSFIHEARDAQRLLNYSRGETFTEIKNRRREQYIATPDNISGFEQMWKNPELQIGALIAKPDPKTGMMPTKMPAWEISQGLFATSSASGQDIREILGFSENQELQGRDISGKARRERKLEGSMSAGVYFSNLNQAIEQGGRICNDLFPYIFEADRERNIIISRKSGKSESIVINQRKGDKVLNQIAPGEYDVEIDVGQSFAVQKEIALEFLQQTLQVFPQAFPLIADLWAKNLDVQFMPQISDRFKTLVPPEIIAKEEGQPPPPPKPPSPEQQMMEQEMKNKQQEIMERAEELKIRQEKHELEKAELMLKAQEMQSKGMRESQRDQTEMSKANLDFQAKIAKILSDMHKK